jgi:hypothetical protein
LVEYWVVEQALEYVSADWTTHARYLRSLGQPKDSAITTIDGIRRNPERGNWFTAAFYIRHLLDEDLVKDLFEAALKKSAEENDLWWQVRSLQELQWTDKLNSLLIRNEARIRSSGDLLLLKELEQARGDDGALIEVEKEIARKGPSVYFTQSSDDESDDEDET